MLFVVFIVSLVAHNILKVQAISCYLCESVYSMDCGKDFELEAAFKFDCARVPPPRFLENDLHLPNATACMKKVYRESGEEKIVRSCYFGDVNDTSIGCRTDPAMTATVHEISCHVCDNENYCNAASSLLLHAKRIQSMTWIDTLLMLALAHLLYSNI